MEELLKRLESAIVRLEKLGGANASAPSSASSPTPVAHATSTTVAGAPGSASVDAFQNIIANGLSHFVKQAEALENEEALKASKIVESAFEAERTIVSAISQCKKPDPASLQDLLKPLGSVMASANELAEKAHPRSEAFFHLKAVAESLGALTWVAYTSKDCGLSLPGPHIDETWPAAEFYTNKILVANKNKEGGAPHVAWAKALKDLIAVQLRDYVKKFHPTGPAWASAGVDLSAFTAAAAAPAGAAQAAQGRKAPPPPPPAGPPPPPPPPAAALSASTAAGSASDMSKVFAELNKGEAVTAGLRKVTADMKTKNRKDRSSLVPAAASAGAGSAVQAGAASRGTAASAAPPKLELQQGRKWVVENQVNNKDITISETEPRQTVYIYGCRNSLIQVKGKVNNITLDKCVRSGLVFNDVVAACEIVNCNSVEVQCQGTAPTFAVDNTTGCQVYLPSTSLNAVVTTAKSSSVNVLVPGSSADVEWVEHALPEQFTNEFKDGLFVTTPVSHSG